MNKMKKKNRESTDSALPENESSGWRPLRPFPSSRGGAESRKRSSRSWREVTAAGAEKTEERVPLVKINGQER